jgi:hypothetical protein
MSDYTNEFGDLYTEDEVNQIAQENATTIDEVISQNKLRPTANKPKKPGKRKSVAKEDAVATAKSTASKLVKPSSGSLTDYFSNKIAKEVTSKASFMKQTTPTFGEVVSGEEFDFKTAGKSPEYKKRQAQLLEKQKKETEKKQAELINTSKYRTRVAKEEISFDTPTTVLGYDLEGESAVETVAGLNKKLNRLGIEVSDNTFGNKLTFKPIGASIGFTDKEAQTFTGQEFDPKDKKGINEYISRVMDANYSDKVKERVNKTNPDYLLKITPPTLPKEEKETQARNSLINGFKRLEEEINGLGIGESAAIIGGKTQVNKKEFENPKDYELYKIWKANPKALLPLSQEKINAWDKGRRTDFTNRASTDYARDLSPEKRKDLQILAQEKVNETKYALKSLTVDYEKLQSKVKLYNKNTELYKKNPTPEGLTLLKEETISLLNEQNSLGDRQKQLEQETDTTNEIMLPAIKSFGANYNRVSQLANATKSTAANVLLALKDVSAYGSAAITGSTHEEVMKRDNLGLVYMASELNKKQQEYQKSVGVDEIDSFDDAGNWLMGGIVNNVPSVAMAFTGPAAMPLFFASGYGGKATQMQAEAEEAKQRLSKNYYALENTTNPFEKAGLEQQIAADENLLSLPEYKKFAAKTIYGGAEVTFEVLGTLKILKGLGDATKMLPKKTLQEGLKWAGKTAAKNFKTEGLSELGTTITNNFADIYILGENKNLFEGGLESFAQGGVMGIGFGGVETTKVIKRAVVSELAAKKQSRRIQDIAKQISEITGVSGYALNQGIPLTEQAPAVQKLVTELLGESEGIENDIINRLGIDLTIEQATQVGNINREIRGINKDFYEAAQDGSLEPAQLKALETHYRGKFNELVNQRETLLTDPAIIAENKQANTDHRFEFDLTQGYKMYNTRMQQTSINQVITNFNNLDEKQSQELLAIAKKELELDPKVKDITEESIKDKAFENYAQTHYAKLIKAGIKNATVFAESKGVNVAIQEFEGDIDGKTADERIIEAFNESEEAKALGAKEEFANGIDKGTIDGANVTINGKNIALVHIKNAASNGRTGIGSHEVLHTAVKMAFKDQKGVDKAGKDLLSYLEKYDPNLYALVTQRIDSSYSEEEDREIVTKKGLKKVKLRLRDEKGELIKDSNYYEEALNALSDLGSDGVELPVDSLNAVRNFVNSILPKGFPKFKEEEGAAVYQFVKDYNKEAHFGKKMPSNLINFSKKAFGGDQEEKPSRRLSITKVNEVQAKIDKLEDQYDSGEIDDYAVYENALENLEKELERAKAMPETIAKPKVETKPKVEATAEDEVNEIIKNEKGSISSDKVQRIYEAKGLNGAQDIIDLFKPITNKIVDKRRDAPGFEKKLLTDEIETGAGGILDLIKSYNAEKGVPLAAYINKQLPLRAIAASRRVLDEQFSKDVTEEKAIMAEETVTETKEKPKYKNALESKVFAPEVLKTATNKILTIVRTLKSRIDAPVTMNRTVTPLISEIRDEVGKQLDIDVKTMLGGKKDGVLRKELLRTKRYILENMTTTWLMGKDGQGGIPQAIQKQIDGKWVSYPDWVGQKIDREKTTTDQAGRTSGAELVRRLPNVANNVSDADFLAQVIGPDGNPIRGRKESLSKAMSEEGAFDIINADLAEEGPIFEALATNQTRLGVEVMENFPITFQKDSDRGNVKYSKTFNSFNNSQKQYIISNSINLATELANINYSIVPDTEDIFKVLQKVYNNGTIPNDDLKELSKDIASYYTPILAPLLKVQSIDYVKNFIDASLIRNSNKIDEVKNKTNEVVISLFTNPTQIREAITTTSNFIKDLGKKYKGEELNARLRKMGAFLAYQAQIGDDSFTIENNQLIPQTPRLTKKGKSKTFSYQIFSSKPAFWAASKFALETNLEKGFSSNREGYIKDSAKALYANKNNKKYLANKKATAIENQKFLYEILDWYYDPKNDVSKPVKAMLWASLNSSQETPLRKAAIAKWIFDETSGPKDFGELRYEHLKSVDKTKAQLHKVFNSSLPEQERKNKFAEVMSDFNVAIIPISMDKEIAAKGFQTEGIAGDSTEGARYYNIATAGNEKLYSLINLDPNAEVKTLGKGFTKFSKTYNIQNAKNTEAITNSLNPKFSKTPKGISVFDFDDTVGLTKSNVLYTMPDGTKGKLNGAEFAAQGSSLLEAGAIFDFSEFSKVVDGKPGPMVEKMKKMITKFGPDNFFILTARPADSAGPIHQFLSSIGIDIPLENITGLGSSLAQAKADWITNKATEGYNDFYFADDHLPNVNAVKDALNVLDVKSKIQQARVKFSKTISPEFNRIIEANKGTERYKVFSDIVAKRRGAGKNLFDVYVPASAADFELLLYNFLGKGSVGETQKKFFEDALLKPYANGNDLMDAARQSIKKDYKALTDAFPNIRKKIEKLTPDGDFTYDQAIRVAMWTEAGIEIPGISQRDANKLTALVNNDPELNAFKAGLITMGRQGPGWITPTQHWDADTIIADLHNITEGAGRKKFLAEFIENSEEMFGKFENGKLVGSNINKVEAVYGTDVREAIEDVLYRMINGKNRGFGQDKETTAWSNWVNGSTGAIMFLNTRSAALQLIGAVNFLNLRDNNPIAAGAAFANQKQYWKDFARIWNSDKMKERRGGLKEDVASAEIANAAATSKNKPAAVIAYLLKIGYTPTQLADSFAIASGGAPFYRNRIKSYLKEGLTEAEAETAAWSDFTKISDETQQSGDPRDISKQQASAAGRLLLTFQNTAMQQSRIVKKSFLDLKNGRGNAKTHVSKIIYYLAIQNTLFAVLQQGLFAVAFDDEDEELDTEKEKAKKKTTNDKLMEVANGVLDTVLRGAGFAGGVVSVLKNMIKKYLDEKDKNFKADYAKVMLEGANISPPIGSKLRKVYTGLQQTKFEKDLITERGWGVMQDGRVHLGPMYGVTGKLVEAGTNLPMDRLVNKIENVSQALNSQNQAWQRVAVGVGFTPYSVGIEDTKGDEEIRAKAKGIRKEEGIEKAYETRQRTKDSVRNLPMEGRKAYYKKEVEKRIESTKKSIERLRARKKRKMGGD